MIEKETRVYVLAASEFSAEKGGYSMDIWNDYEQAGLELPEEAKVFMKEAEEKGGVFSLKEFLVAYNINDEVGMNNYVFITKAY